MKIHPFLDKEKQKRAKQYEKENRILGLIQAIFSLFILWGFYSTGLSSFLSHLTLGNSFIWTFLVYVFSFQGILMILGLPLSFYNGYIHEHKWGFSTQTVKSWLGDQAKSSLVNLVITGILLFLLLRIMDLFPHSWWLMAGLAMAVVSMVFSTLFPVIILPIFNKYTSIQDKELCSALNKILAKEGLKSSGFFKEDTSRQTKKENAFLAGLGKTRRVVLADNLLRNMSIPQIVSIIGHEVGHYKYKHMWKYMAVGTVQQLVVFFLIHLIMKGMFPRFLSSTSWNLTLFPIIVIFMGVISGFLFGPLFQALSRYFEREADRYSLENIEDKRAFLVALAGLADRNLSNAYPPLWVKLLYYSHPPIGERLQMGEDFLKKDEMKRISGKRDYSEPSQQ